MATLLIQPLQAFPQSPELCRRAVVRSKFTGADRGLANDTVTSPKSDNRPSNTNPCHLGEGKIPRLEGRRAATEDVVADGTIYGFHTSSRSGSKLIQGAPPGVARSNVEPEPKPSKTAEAVLSSLAEGPHVAGHQIVRKNSGELVKPALRKGRRHTNLDPTKSVHFALGEDTCHFFRAGRPVDISNGLPPTDSMGERRLTTLSAPYKLEIIDADSTYKPPSFNASLVYLERFSLSRDQKGLVGSAAVANIAFQKIVTCRYTLDNWGTLSDVAAEFTCKARRKDSETDWDRFTFTIELPDSVISTTTLYFCIRYSVDGQEYWDNNSGANFRVSLRKTYQSVSDKPGGLPAHRVTPLTVSSLQAPTIFDEVGRDITANLGLKRFQDNDMPKDDISSQLLLLDNLSLTRRYSFDACLAAVFQVTHASPKRFPVSLSLAEEWRGRVFAC